MHPVARHWACSPSDGCTPWRSCPARCPTATHHDPRCRPLRPSRSRAGAAPGRSPTTTRRWWCDSSRRTTLSRTGDALVAGSRGRNRGLHALAAHPAARAVVRARLDRNRGPQGGRGGRGRQVRNANPHRVPFPGGRRPRPTPDVSVSPADLPVDVPLADSRAGSPTPRPARSSAPVMRASRRSRVARHSPHCPLNTIAPTKRKTSVPRMEREQMERPLASRVTSGRWPPSCRVT